MVTPSAVARVSIRRQPSGSTWSAAMRTTTGSKTRVAYLAAFAASSITGTSTSQRLAFFSESPVRTAQ
ncbi:MAG: hypothetical protein ACRDRJ_29365 [Streptosporangiaceae bacterium]